MFAETTRFEVIIEPDTITVWEYADMTIKAVDDSGNVDTSSQAEFYMVVDGFERMSDDVEFPNLGYYNFKASDQWVKIFSKWFTIKKAWTHEVQIKDLFDEVSGISGKATIKVNEEGWWVKVGTLEVSSPTANAELSDERVAVIATSSLPIHPIVLYIDDEKVQEWTTNQDGEITLYVSWIEPGKHNLLLNAVDLWGTVVASSEVIPFVYKEVDHGSLFVWLEITPSNMIMEWEKVTLKVTTADVVDSVTVKIWDGETIPTSKTGKGVFTKELLLESAWEYSVDLGLMVQGSETIQEDVDTITVNKDIKKVKNLSYIPISDQDQVALKWEFEGKVDFFKISYGQNKNNLDLSLTSTIPSGTLILTDATKTRYTQVHPIDQDGQIIGEASEVITINPLRKPDPICGNRKIELWEECDDGNILNGDGCSSVCRIESAVCGNRRIEVWEECDDGNIVDGDGCSFTCQIQELQAPPQECETWGILLNTKVVDGKYYLYRAPVANAKKYLVYRQESRPWSISQMSLVWESTDPIFEYPFDPNAAADQFARYAIEAQCEDNTKQQLWDFTKVKVGPEQTLMIMLLMVLLLRGFRRMTAEG